MERRDFLAGALTGVVAGLGVSAGVGELRDRTATARRAAEQEALPAVGEGPAPDPAPAPAPYDWSQHGRLSYAQQGEDILLVDTFEHLGIANPTYIDIGAHHPVIDNNTYLLYLAGSRGVLVEPNPTWHAELQRVRPEDRALNIGIGVSDETEADYFIIKGGGQNNTFSREQADRYVAASGPEVIEEVRKMPLVNINTVIAEQFSGAAPDLFSIDIEGLDLAVLRTLDLERFRPRVFCVETMRFGTLSREEPILEFLTAAGYEARGGSFVNTLFIDRELLRSG